MQPVGPHESVVHGLPSLQSICGWLHCPVEGSQMSVVQGFVSSQLVVVVETHEPLEQ
jgi:hypothetical protein